MVRSKAATPEQYLQELPPERRELVETIRRTILDHLPDGYREEMTFGMLGYVIPLEDFPDTYNGEPLGAVALANQKQYVSVYLFGIYADDAEREWFVGAWKATGRKLDMGKSCIRVKRLDDVALDVLAAAVERVPPERILDAHRAAHGRTPK
jgi:hypothetical protein